MRETDIIKIKLKIRKFFLKIRQIDTKRFIWRFCKAALKTLSVLFILYIIFIASLLTIRWKSLNSPYDIGIEYNRVQYLGLWRSNMLEQGIPENDYLYQLLKKQQEKDFQYIKNIVPKEDFIMDILGWYINYCPYFYDHNDRYNKASPVLDWLINAINKKSQISVINDKTKFYFLKYVVYRFLQNTVLEMHEISPERALEFLEALEGWLNEDIVLEDNNVYGKVMMQSVAVSIAKYKIWAKQGASPKIKIDAKQLCSNSYYPMYINQLYILDDYIKKLPKFSFVETYILNLSRDIDDDKKRIREDLEFHKTICLK